MVLRLAQARESAQLACPFRNRARNMEQFGQPRQTCTAPSGRLRLDYLGAPVRERRTSFSGTRISLQTPPKKQRERERERESSAGLGELCLS